MVWICHIQTLLCWCSFPLASFSGEFFFLNHKWVLNFVETFFCIYLEDYMIFILQFVNTVYHTDWFCVLKNPCIPDINFTWSWCLILLMCYWIEFASILLRIFVCIFICDIGRKNREKRTQKNQEFLFFLRLCNTF